MTYDKAAFATGWSNRNVGAVHAHDQISLWLIAGMMNAPHGPPMTLGNAVAASVRLLVWCLDCGHRSEPDPRRMAERFGTYRFPVRSDQRSWSSPLPACPTGARA